MGVVAHWEGEPVSVWERTLGVPRFEAHDVLGSTNDRARALAREGAAPFTVVVAAEQTAGRGRTGARWHSPPGAGLWMSVVLPLAGPPPAYLPLLVGLAAARAVETVCPELTVGVKWPNDLVVAGRKAGGILCERADGSVIAGIGLNVRQRPEDFPGELAGRAISLEGAVGRPVALGTLAAGLVSGLHTVWIEPTASLPASVQAELAARDVLRDRRVISEQAGNGIARGIDRDGALLLERSDGARVRVLAGSVRIA